MRSEKATAILAIDTSRSMGANDVAPTRLAAAQASARRFLDKLPGKYRVSVVAFSSLAQVVAVPTGDRAYVRAAIASLRVGEATAIGDAISTALDVARGTPQGVKPAPGDTPVPAVIMVFSDGAADGGRVTLTAAIKRARAAKVPVFTSLIGTDAGIVQVPRVGGYVERIQVPPDANCAEGARGQDGRALLHRADRERLREGLRQPHVAPRHDAQERGDRVRVRGRRRAAAGRGLRPLRALVQEDPVIRAAAVALALAGALALGVASSGAAGECSGLKICIPVAGPWVKIPAPAAGAVASASWRLVCPQGVVGGVDARASEAAVGVEFPGLLGSPVNPGITTSRSLVFTGRYAGRARRPTSFRPFIGCLPGGGGGPRTPTSLAAASDIRPGDPIALRIVSLDVRAGRLARATLRCQAGERLLGARHSVGLYTGRVPTRAELTAVRVVRVRRGGRVLVSATRRKGLAAAVQVVVQVQAECAR